MPAISGKRVLVLGGAGFIGSHIVDRFLHAGCQVTVLDGLIPGTGGRLENLHAARGRIQFIPIPVEEFASLGSLLRSMDVVVDAMAWTSHQLAMKEPLRDLRMNAASHLHVLQAIAGESHPQIIYLGSRSQYGNVSAPAITEDSPMVPEDIQGIHKAAADSYYRIFARSKRLAVCSLRIPNCFGPRQMRDGEDIGLVGSFVRDLLAGRKAQVFGTGRRRALIYVGDVADAVVRLAEKGFAGYQAFNLSGYELTIEELVVALIATLGSGAYDKEPLPDEVQASDLSSNTFDDSRCRRHLQLAAPRDLGLALRATCDYFRRRAA